MKWGDFSIWEYFLIVVLFLVTWNMKTVLRWLGRSVDKDGDGRTSWGQEIVPVLFSIATIIIAYMEVRHDGEQISDLKFIFLAVSYLGSSTVVAVLQAWAINKNMKDSDAPDTYKSYNRRESNMPKEDEEA